MYDLARVQERLRQMGPEGIRVINEDAALDMAEAFDPPFTEDELLSLLLALLPEEDFVRSVWCRTGVGMVIDCDAYTVHYNRNRGCRWPPGRKVYVKFGFREPQLPCIVVSIHPSIY